jgi:hypothetical protein
MYWLIDNRPPTEIEISRFWGVEGGKSQGPMLFYTLQNMALTKFLTSPISITIQYHTQYRPLSDASICINFKPSWELLFSG